MYSDKILLQTFAKTVSIIPLVYQIETTEWGLNNTTFIAPYSTISVEFQIESLRACSHQTKVGAKAKKIKGQAKKSDSKRQTSEKIFAFGWCEWALTQVNNKKTYQVKKNHSIIHMSHMFTVTLGMDCFVLQISSVTSGNMTYG